MNKEILTKHINNYLDKINKNGEIDDLKEREQRKEGRESLDVSPHARDQSKRVPLKEASI